MLEWILLLVTVVVLWKWVTHTPAGFPPGPTNWPIIGAFPSLKGKYFHRVLAGLSERYGPVVGMKFGLSINAVSISGPLVIEVLKREEFLGRNKTVRGQIPRPGITFKDGEHWKEQRRFALRHLRDFGFGKSSTESVIVDEAMEFFEKRLRGKNEVQVSGLFGTSAINVLWAVMGGERFAYDDMEFEELLEVLRDSFRSDNVAFGFLRTLPIARKLFPKWSGAHGQKVLEARLRSFMQRKISEHRRTLSDSPRDFIDVYLQELFNEKRGKSFNDESLMAVCLDLFTAGAESVSNTLAYCLLYLLRYPSWQDKLYSEIMDELGTDASPSMTQRSKLPTVEAFLCEVSRHNTIAPITPPKRCLKDTYLDGHFIPENAFMFINLWSVLNDKAHWGDPEVFRPERFINKNGTFRPDNYMINFGAGSRQCVGESLARSFLFVFLVVMVREFKFVLPEGEALPSEEPGPGLTLAPQPFHVKPIPRSV